MTSPSVEKTVLRSRTVSAVVNSGYEQWAIADGVGFREHVQQRIGQLHQNRKRCARGVGHLVAEVPQPNGARGDEYALLVDYGSEKELIEKFKTLIQEYI